MPRPNLRQSSGGRGLAEQYQARYEMLGHIGSGSFGSVHLVRYKGKGTRSRNAVVKIAELSNMKPEAKQQAKDEVVRLAELNHPNIVGYYESFLLDGKLHIIMEYANGGTLEHKIKQAAKAGVMLDIANVKKWYAELLLAVGYIHHKHLIHRDIKPANVFLHNGAVKLGDFGVTRELDNTLAMAKTQAGTPFYMSPEQLSGEGYNCCADVWALGCVLYELLTTRKAFESKSIMQLCLKVNNVDYKPLDSSVEACFRELLPRMLCKDTKSRITIKDAQAMPWVEAVFDAHAGPKKPVTPNKNPQSGTSGTPSTPLTPKPPSVVLPPPSVPPPALPNGDSVPTPPPIMRVKLKMDHGSPSNAKLGAAATLHKQDGALPEPVTPARKSAKRMDHYSNNSDSVQNLTKSMKHRMKIDSQQDQLKKSMARIGLRALRSSYSTNNDAGHNVDVKSRAENSVVAATIKPGFGVAKLSMFESTGSSSERFGMGADYRQSLEGTFGSNGMNPFAANGLDLSQEDSYSVADISPDQLQRASELFKTSDAVRSIPSVSLESSSSSSSQLSSSPKSVRSEEEGDASDENECMNACAPTASAIGGAGATKASTAAAMASAASAARRGSSRQNRPSSLGGCDVAIVFKEADSSKGTPERFSVDYRRSTGRGLRGSSDSRQLPIVELNLDDIEL